MYQYTEFDKSFVRSRASQFRDQLERWQDGRLSEDAFRPLRLQNGWYVQRHAPMLRVAVPYGELSIAPPARLSASSGPNACRRIARTSRRAPTCNSTGSRSTNPPT